jgi:DNA-binding transcriptional regulator GbsR (MarR family)
LFNIPADIFQTSSRPFDEAVLIDIKTIKTIITEIEMNTRSGTVSLDGRADLNDKARQIKSKENEAALDSRKKSKNSTLQHTIEHNIFTAKRLGFCHQYTMSGNWKVKHAQKILGFRKKPVALY